MSVPLRAFPVPYLTVDLDARYFQVASSHASKLAEWLEEKGETVHRRRIREAEQRVLTSLAFANAYDFIDQFRKKTPQDFRWDSYSDYSYKGKKIKLIGCTISERWGNTGPNTVIRMSKKVLAKSDADYFIAAAFCIPSISFLGWFNRDGLLSASGPIFVEPLANSSKLNPMWELEPLEKKRSKGYYV